MAHAGAVMARGDSIPESAGLRDSGPGSGNLSKREAGRRKEEEGKVAGEPHLEGPCSQGNAGLGCMDRTGGCRDSLEWRCPTAAQCKPHM